MSKVIGVFADISNLFYCVGKRFPTRKLDYGNFLVQAIPEGDVLYRAIAFGVQIETEATKFITCLKHLGYEAKYKQPRILRGVDGKQEYRRVSWCCGIAMDVVRIVSLNKLDTVVLGSSDPELAPLVEWVKEHGVRCEILSCGISKELKDCADSFKEIGEDLLEVLPPIEDIKTDVPEAT